MELEQEKDAFISHLETIAKDIYLQPSISKEDEAMLKNAIENLKAIPEENKEELEKAVIITYGIMNLCSNKGIYHNISELNKAIVNQNVPQEMKDCMKSMETSLETVVKALESGNLELYKESMAKVDEVGKEFEKLNSLFTK